MKLFNKKKWLKPEINEPKYYLHLAILVVSALIILKYIFNHDMLNQVMFVKVFISLLIADIIAHTSLKLN